MRWPGPMHSLLCYGDSNTHGTLPLAEGVARGRHPASVRWPRRLATMLGDDWQVIEEGLPGRSTVFDDPIDGEHKNGWRTLVPILESHRPLDAVILMLGTNDLKSRYGVTPKDIGAGVERLGRRILASGHDRGAGHDDEAPALLIVAPPHVLAGARFDLDGTDMVARSRSCSATIAAAADRLGAGFLDAGPRAAFHPADGVHLDEQGHAALAAAIGPALVALLAVGASA